MEKNIALSIMKSIDENNQKSAFENETLSLNYEQLGRLIGAIVIKLKESKLSRGSLLGIYTHDPRLAVAGAVAANWLGAPWIEVNFESLNAKNFKITHTLCLLQNAYEFDHNNKLVITDDWVNDIKINNWREICPFVGFSDSKKIARVKQSSGTTGRKKFILCSAESEFKSIVDNDYYFNDCKKNYTCLLPPLSAGGFNTRVKNLINGGTNISVNSDNYNLYEVDTVLGSPFHLSEIIKEFDAGRVEKIKNAIVMGGDLTEHLAVKLKEYFDSILITYAYTEIGVVGTRIIDNAKIYDRKLFLVPDKGLRFEIIDQNDRQSTFGNVGVIRIKRDGIPVIYTDGKRDEWFYPGDAGVEYKGRSFKVIGRLNDSLNINGSTVNAGDIDNIIQSIEFIEDGYCFLKENEAGLSELHLIAKYNDMKNSDYCSEKVLEIVSKYLPETAVPKSVFVVDNVPRTNTGKPMRYKISKILDQKISKGSPNGE